MSKIIVDAQLLLNTHRMYHGIMQYYYGVTKNLAQILGESLEQEASMLHTLYEIMNGCLKKSVSINKKASLRLEDYFLGSHQNPKKGLGHQKSLENDGIGLKLPLSDYCLVLKNQRKAYKALMTNASKIKSTLHMMFMDDATKENPDCAESIWLLLESLAIPIELIGSIDDKLLRILEDFTNNHLKEEDQEDPINAIAFLHDLDQKAGTCALKV